MAQNGGGPAWDTIPDQTFYRGQRVSINLANYSNSLFPAVYSFRPTVPPNWLTLDLSWIHGFVPTGTAVGTNITVNVRISNSAGHADTSFTIRIVAGTAPTPNQSAQPQNLVAGQAFSFDLASSLTGTPTPTVAFRSGTTPPSWLGLNGSRISGTPPVADYSSATSLTVQFTITNVAGSATLSIVLRIDPAILPAWTAISAQYAVQDEEFYLNLSTYLAGKPTPSLTLQNAPFWVRLDGLALRGTPTGYSRDQSVAFAIRATNAAGHSDYTLTIHVRVVGTLFSEATSGSPISIPHNNLQALVATVSRFYYGTADTNGRIYVVTKTGTAQASEEISLSTHNSANSHGIHGLAIYNDQIYVLCGTGTRYVHKYNLSDKSYVGSQDVGERATGITIGEIGGHSRLFVLTETGSVRVFSLLFPSQSAGEIAANFFRISAPGVSNSEWQGMGFDMLDSKIFIGATRLDGALLYAFNVNGTRDHNSSVRLDSANWDPRGVAYWDDYLYVGQYTAYTTPPNQGGAKTTGEIYVYETGPRVLPIPGQEGFATQSFSLDLTPYLANSMTLSFNSGYPTPSWLTLTGKVLEGTLPARTEDDHEEIQLTGTHGTRTVNFSVNLTIHALEAPVWEQIPDQTLDEPVAATQPDANLRTSLDLHLRDYVNSSAGDVTFSFEQPSHAFVTIRDRQLDGRTIHDVLHIDAPRVSPPQGITSQDYTISISAQNAAGRAGVTFVLHITDLALPAIAQIPDQIVYRDTIDQIDLSIYATGIPTPTFETRVAAPQDVLVDLTSTGQLTIRPNPRITSDIHGSLDISVSNRVGTATQSFNLVVYARSHPLPPIIPSWKPVSELEFQMRGGLSRVIDLTRYIATSRPQPTFVLDSSSGMTGDGGTVSVTGTTLNVTAPRLTADAVGTAQITATNSAGSAQVTLTFDFTHVTLPAWHPIPRQEIRPGETLRLDLNSFVTADPAATVTFQSGFPTQGSNEENAIITNGILTWEVPDTITESVDVNFDVQATNANGTGEHSFLVHVVVLVAPVWVSGDVQLTAIEGSTDNFDLGMYVVGGADGVTFSLARGAAALNLVVHENTLILTNAPPVAIETDYEIEISAKNAAGTTTKDVLIRILPHVAVGELTRFTEDDYDEIRKLLDLRLTAAELPDEVIAGDSYEQAALSWVALQVAGRQVERPEDVRKRHRAALYRAAGLLAPSVSRLTTEAVGSLREQYIYVDFLQLQSVLFLRAEEELAQLSDEEIRIETDYFGSFDISKKI